MPRLKKTPELMRKFGEFVHSLSGRYITAEDMGMETSDMDIVRDVTPYVTVISESRGGAGNPSAVTAYGVYIRKEDLHGAVLRGRGILYAPDFLINAGGIINVYAELAHYGKEEIMSKTENIYNTTLEIINYGTTKGMTTHQAALTIAQNRIDQRRIENSSK